MPSGHVLSCSRLFRRLKNGAHGQLVELYAARLVEVGLARQGTWRCLNVVGDLLDWMARHRTKLTNLDERLVERYLRHQGAKKCSQLGNRAALMRLLLTLRAAGTIAPAAVSPRTPHEQIFAELGAYLRSDCGLSAKTIMHHLPAIRRFLFEVCPDGTSGLCEITRELMIHYIWASRPGLEPEVRQGDVLAAARISQIPSSHRIEPALAGWLRALHQAMEARKSSNLPRCGAGSEGSGWLRPCVCDGAPRLRHLDAAVQAWPAG